MRAADKHAQVDDVERTRADDEITVDGVAAGDRDADGADDDLGRFRRRVAAQEEADPTPTFRRRRRQAEPTEARVGRRRWLIAAACLALPVAVFFGRGGGGAAPGVSAAKAEDPGSASWETGPSRKEDYFDFVRRRAWEQKQGRERLRQRAAARTESAIAEEGQGQGSRTSGRSVDRLVDWFRRLFSE